MSITDTRIKGSENHAAEWQKRAILKKTFTVDNGSRVDVEISPSSKDQSFGSDLALRIEKALE